MPDTDSVVAYFPESDVTIVVLANSSLTDLDHDLLRRLLEDVVSNRWELDRPRRCLDRHPTTSPGAGHAEDNG